MELVVAIQEIVKVNWVAEIVLELFIIEAQVIDSDDFVGMIVESVATQISLASVMGIQLIPRH